MLQLSYFPVYESTFSLFICWETSGLCQFPAILNRTAMITAEQVSVKWDMKVFGHMPKNDIAESLFLYFEDFPVYFQSNCMNLHSHQHEWSFLLHASSWTFLSVVWWILAILSVIRWNLKYISICMFLIVIKQSFCMLWMCFIPIG